MRTAEPRSFRRWTGAAMLAWLLLLPVGCVTTEEPVWPRGYPTDQDGRTGRTGQTDDNSQNTRLDKPLAPAGGTAGSVHLLTQLERRGAIPFDQETLPIVSPDGRYLATQVGLAPPLETVLAGPGASVPATTRVEIYHLSENTGEHPVFVAVVDEPVLLGRASDETGFLVEAPRHTGERWIGLASWLTGEITWLAQDPGAVCAFATMGPDGQLAYSRRAINGTHFDLVVSAGTELWTLPGQGEDWLMPTWSGAGDGLFVLLLRGDLLEVIFLRAANEADVYQGIRRQRLASTGATINTAYQALNAHQVIITETPPTVDRLYFYHPAGYRAAVWEPPGLPRLLTHGSWAVTRDVMNEQFVMLAGKERIERVSLANNLARSRLVDGVRIPRPTGATDRPYILLEPGAPAPLDRPADARYAPGDPVIGITILRVYDADPRKSG